MTASDILNRYITFFEKRGHKRIANAPLVPINDPTTLFTSSGMQALIPYLLGETHPQGTRLVNVQNCLRSQDIDEVGDNRHTTFFRMLGNWSLGDYFKDDQIPWFWEFLTDKKTGLGLNPEKLFITVFDGDDKFKVYLNGKYQPLTPDVESKDIWTKTLEKESLKTDERVFSYGPEKNWWSRSGTPKNMPIGEPGGPDSEVFYDFGADLRIHENSPYKDKECHPNCDCGRFMEIGNSVFMQYKKIDDRTFEELPKKNVDFGGGLERLSAAVNNNPDVFTTDLYGEIIKQIETVSGHSYNDGTARPAMRVIADHMKAAVFLIVAGVIPANKERGYVLRRLLRRAAVKMHQFKGELTPVEAFQTIADTVLATEEKIDEKMDRGKNKEQVFSVIEDEMGRFAKTLDKGLKILQKTDTVNGKVAFDLFQSYGFPFEITEELASQKGGTLRYEDFAQEYEKHKQLSKTASAGMFKGGLADHSDLTVKGHTATHLLHQALRDVLGNHVHQSGSNITSERVRFDFNYDKRLTDEEMKKVEDIVNEKIRENLPVHFELIPTKEAYEMGAIGLFMDTYGDKSKIYFIGDTAGDYKDAYSIEFCGGPHVDFTGVLKSAKIIKQESLGKNQKRLYMIVQG